MQHITEQMILALAPNPAAAANGRKISIGGGFVRLGKSEDDTFFLGECKGSGKSNYITTADYLDPAQPVFRCSCPSRQFPCKHSLALLYEMMAEKMFACCDIPEDILQKRAKKQAKANSGGYNKDIGGEKAEVEEKKKTVGKGHEESSLSHGQGKSQAARTKKLQKQLEGLELVSKLICELLNTGLGAMGGTALTDYRNLSKQLGDYYLPGPQILLNGLILEIAAYQTDGDDGHYDRAVDILKRLRALVKKSAQYLGDKLQSGEVGQDDNLLFEELGGTWKLSELSALGLVKEQARLAQISFWVEFDGARGAFIDIGCWADVDTGVISLTQNYRPVKALKHVKQDDTVFGMAKVPLVCCYPGEGNRRVRWDGMELCSLGPEELEKLISHGALLAPAVKEAKNILKNTLSSPLYCKLLRLERIGMAGEDTVLEDGAGGSILLGNMPGMEPTLQRLCTLPDASFLEHQVLLGAFYYDEILRRILVQPLSIVTAKRIVRLLY